MIKIHKAYIKADNSVELSVETEQFENIERILIYSLENFEDPSKAVDVSYLLRKVDHTEDLIIPSEEFSQNKIEGFYLIKIKTSTRNIDNYEFVKNEALAVISNHIKYETCILEKVLKIEIEGCEEKSVIDDCEDCTEKGVESACYISTLFNALKGAVQHGFYAEAKQIKKQLDCVCKPCKGCPEYLDSEFSNGTGFGTFDNNVILI